MPQVLQLYDPLSAGLNTVAGGLNAIYKNQTDKAAAEAKADKDAQAQLNSDRTHDDAAAARREAKRKWDVDHGIDPTTDPDVMPPVTASPLPDTPGSNRGATTSEPGLPPPGKAPGGVPTGYAPDGSPAKPAATTVPAQPQTPHQSQGAALRSQYNDTLAEINTLSQHQKTVLAKTPFATAVLAPIEKQIADDKALLPQLLAGIKEADSADKQQKIDDFQGSLQLPKNWSTMTSSGQIAYLGKREDAAEHIPGADKIVTQTQAQINAIQGAMDKKSTRDQNLKLATARMQQALTLHNDTEANAWKRVITQITARQQITPYQQQMLDNAKAGRTQARVNAKEHVREFGVEHPAGWTPPSMNKGQVDPLVQGVVNYLAGKPQNLRLKTLLTSDTFKNATPGQQADMMKRTKELPAQ